MDWNPHLTLRRISPVLGVLGACAALAVGANAAVGHADGVPHRAHPAASPCTRQTTVHGHSATVYCGPAAASLTVSGHTYDFHGGQCIRAGGQLIVSLGVVVSGDTEHNGGKPNFGLTISGHTSGALVAIADGHSLIEHFALIKSSTGPAGQGTFTGHTALHATPFHGSWNCHGAIVTT